MHYILYVSIYLIVIFLYIAIYKIFYKKTGIFSTLSKVMLCSIIVVLSAIRCNFGSDYYSYYRLYNIVRDQIVVFGGIRGFIENNIQVGFPYLMHVVRQFSNSPYAIFAACSLIIYPSLFHWIDKKTNNKTYSIALFFLLGLFDITNNILKQSLALCALVYAFDALIEKRYIKYSLLSAIAILFHISSVVPLITMIIARIIKMTKKRIFSLVGISTVLCFGYSFFITRIISSIPILGRYSDYSRGRVFSAPFVATSILYTLLFMFFSIRRIDAGRINTEADIIRANFVALNVVFSILSLRYIVILRLSYLALLQLTILIPQIDFATIKQRRHTIRITSTVFLVVCFFVLTSLLAGNNRYYNYSTIYNSEPQREWYR